MTTQASRATGGSRRTGRLIAATVSAFIVLSAAMLYTLDVATSALIV